MFAPYWALQDAFELKGINDETYVDKSLSWALANTDVFPTILMILGDILILFVCITREIQLRVLFQRNGYYGTVMKLSNILSAITLAASATSWQLQSILCDSKYRKLIHGLVLT